MKTIKLLAALVAAFFALASCEKEPEEVVPVPEITLSADEVILDAEGASVKVIVTVSNMSEGVQPSISVSAAWVSAVAKTESVIEISAEKNDTGKDRTAEVKFSYAGAKDAVISVSQMAWQAPVTLKIDSVEDVAVTLSVVTADPELTWVAQIVGKEWFDEFSDDADIFQEDMFYFNSEAKNKEISLEEYLSSVLFKGTHEGLRYKGLDPLTDYVAYVYGLTTDGKRTTPVYSAPLKTLDPYEGPISFEFNVTEEDHVIDVTITPSHDGVPYYWNIMDEATYEEWGGSMPDAAQALIDWDIQDLLDLDYISSVEEYREWYSDNSEINTQIECLSDTKYIIYAFKWDENCQVSGDVEYVWHTSESVSASDNVLTVSVSNPTQSTFEVEVNTTNNDPYVIMAEPSENWAGMTDAQIFKYIMDNYGTWFITDYICEGDVKGNFTHLDVGTEYTVIAFGYEAGVRTTDIVRENISTLPAGDPKDCTFEFEVKEIKSTSIVASVNPSDAGHYYYWMAYESHVGAEDVKESIRKTINNSYWGDLWEFAYYELSMAYSEARISYLKPDTEYRLAAVVMDDDTGDFLGEVIFSEPFRTEKMKIADIDVKATFDKYYDGDALAAAVPDTYNQYIGYAYLPVTMTIDGEYSEYYYTVFSYVDGLEDPEVYPDASLYESLMMNGVYYALSVNFRANWDTPMVLAAMAVDHEGNYSKVYRHMFTLTRDGASPIEDIITKSSGTVPAASASSFVHAEDKAVKTLDRTGDNRFSSETVNAIRKECKIRKDAERKDAALQRMESRRSVKKHICYSHGN